MGRALARLLGLQLALALMIAAVVFLWSGPQAALAALAGGGIGASGAVAYVAMFGALGPRSPGGSLRGHIAAEAARIAVIVGLLWLGFGWAGPEGAAPLLAGFIATLAANVLVWIWI
jgi:F0F1-type ATP synthase assembly protein I